MSFNKYVKKTNYKINLSEEQQNNYEQGNTCWCGYPFEGEFFDNADDKDEENKISPLYQKINRKKVFDHDHLKEKDNGVGPAHAYCNLQRQTIRFFIPVSFHNGSNYDFHILVR